MRARGCLCGQIYGFAVLITTAMVIPVMVVFGLQSDTQHADAAPTQLHDTTSTQTARTETAPAQAPQPAPGSEPFTYGWARDQGLNARDAERMCKDLAEAASQLASARKQEDRKAAMLAVLKGMANSPRESEADEYSVQLVNRVYDRPDLSPNKLAAAEYMRCMMLQ
jgi:hypothetical protein